MPESATDDYPYGDHISYGVKMFVSVFGWWSCVTGVFGNILVILTLWTQPSLRSTHNLYVGNLAFADLIVVGYIVPCWLVDIAIGYSPLSEAHCQLNSFVLFHSVFSSVYTLVLISFNRYLCVCKSKLYYKVFTRNSTVVYCVCVWFVTGIKSFIPVFHIGGTRYLYLRNSHLCAFNVDTLNVFGVINVLTFLIVTILMGYFNRAIYKTWKGSRSRVGKWTRGSIGAITSADYLKTKIHYNNPDATNSGKQDLRKKSTDPPIVTLLHADRALVNSLVVVFVLLVALYFPMMVLIAAYGWVDIGADVHVTAVFSCFLYHSINWIIYGAMNRKFRHGYRLLLCRWHCCEDLSYLAGARIDLSIVTSSQITCVRDLSLADACHPKQGNSVVGDSTLDSTIGKSAFGDSSLGPTNEPTLGWLERDDIKLKPVIKPSTTAGGRRVTVSSTVSFTN